MSCTPVTGLRCKLYYRSSGTYASPVWTEIKTVSDVNLTISSQGETFVTRENAVEVSAVTARSVEISGRMQVKPTDTAYEAMADAATRDTVHDFLCLTGTYATEHARGVRFDGQIHQANQDQSSGVSWVFDEFTIRPFPCNPILAAKVVGGAPTYTRFGTGEAFNPA